ncbi:unnamed protein product [Amoebophrya sp. A25]|nr:unnamed protein product [Amoebophrya sp. A25]|eukprot:GSA25T00013426001.1
MFLCMTSGGAVGVAISTLTTRAEVSLVLLTVISNTVPACFGGVMRALSQIPASIRWMRHGIPMSHLCSAMGLLELNAIDETKVSDDLTHRENFRKQRDDVLRLYDLGFVARFSHTGSVVSEDERESSNRLGSAKFDVRDSDSSPPCCSP